MTTNDPELDEIVKHSAEKAAELFPRRKYTLRAKIAISIAAFLIVANSVTAIVDSAILSQSLSCQKQQSRALTVLRNQNQLAVSTWINDLSQLALTNKLNSEEVAKLQKSYNDDVAATQVSIDKVRSIKCQ